MPAASWPARERVACAGRANAVQYGPSYASVHLDHTIVGNNTAGESETNDIGGVVDARFSLVEDYGPGGESVIDDGGNIFGVDPQLNPLANNGGLTQTQFPFGNSPVIDAGDPDFVKPPFVDQRGLDRVQSFRIDIGAVEVPGIGETTVSVVASTPQAVEGGADGAFTFTRSGSTASQLVIGYSISGTATSGTDYDTLGTVAIPAGQASIAVPVHALADDIADDGETVVVTVLNGTGYTAASPTAATVTITETAANPNPCTDAADAGFTDVSASNVHKEAIDCLKALGITIGGPNGLPADQYGPAQDVTRGQIATFLARLIETGRCRPALRST